MIITRTPFRVSFAGGGSDLEAFYSHEPGCVLSSAINQYMYITVKPCFGNAFRVSYSETENIQRREQIQHPIVKECLTSLGISKGLEIVSMADLPARTGVGSSSSFTVGLLNALHAYCGRLRSAGELADQACRIEIDRLKEPIGKQDQYIAAFGGLQFIEFRPDGFVTVDPVVCAPAARQNLARHLLVLYTGLTRNAASVLASQKAGMSSRLDQVRAMCGIAREMRNVLVYGGDVRDFGSLLDRAWQIKRGLNENISSSQIDDWYERARRAGALGGKLLGAGNGGFLLLFCEPKHRHRVRAALSELDEIDIDLEPEGSKIVYVGGERWSPKYAAAATA